MNLQFFAYRRLAKWITCVLGVEGGTISLQSKYDVASFQDVFLQPFYWQIYQLLNESPKLIVDCGANCGHFSILADICCRTKFGESDSEFILVEPNPYLIPIIERNLKNSGISSRASIRHALLGEKTGAASLWINKSNFLASSMTEAANSKKYDIPFLDMEQAVGERSIDLMKIDIEGGEFNFVRSNLNLFERVKLLFIEVHDAPLNVQREMFASLETKGLFEIVRPINAHGFQLAVLGRR